MRWKTTVFLLITTVAVGVYIALYEIKQPTPEERAQLSKQVVNISSTAVTQLVLDLPLAKATLTHEATTWTLTPKNVRANSELIERILVNLSPLMSERILTDQPQQSSRRSKEAGHGPLDLKTFGLDPAVGWMTVVANGSPTTLLIGEPTAVPSNRYLKISNRPEVFVVSATLFNTANVSSDTFRDPLLLHLNQWETEQLTLNAPGHTFTLTHHDTEWRLTSPSADRADTTAVNSLLSTLSKIQMKRFVDDAPQVEKIADWGFDQPKASVHLKFSSSSAPLTLFFGNALTDDHTLVYAKRSDEPALYAVVAADVDALLKEPNALRSKTCLEFFTSTATKVEATHAGHSWTLERTEAAAPQAAAQWHVQGEPQSALDTPRIDNFLNKLADLRLAGFVEDTPKDLAHYGLEPPAGTITLWTNNRQTPQRLFLGNTVEQTTERYARIEGRTAIVKLPALSTELLETSTDQFRAAQPTTLPASVATPPQPTSSSPATPQPTPSSGKH